MASRGEALSYGDRPIHPGQYLAEELEARSMTQKALAERMGRPLKTISEIINGKKSITAETALGLERVLSSSARTWMNLQTNYALAKAHLGQREREAS